MVSTALRGNRESEYTCFSPSTFSPLGSSRSRHTGLPDVFKLYAHFHKMSLFFFLSLSGRLYPHISKWLTFSPRGFSYEILTFRKSWEFHNPSCITSPKLHLTPFLVRPKKHYHIAVIFKWCITIYYLEGYLFSPLTKIKLPQGWKPLAYTPWYFRT